MFVTYDGTHSITFGTLKTHAVSDVSGVSHTISYVMGKNTWSDWHLVPSSRPVISPPSPIYKAISIPGTNGTFDMSRLLTGRINYQNRTGSWSFILDHEQSTHWETAYSEIMAYLHGESLVCVLEDDPGFYYEGNFTVSSAGSSNGWSGISVNYDLYPFKKSIQTTDEEWLWDPFNFDMDVVKGYTNLPVPPGSSITFAIQACEEPIKPEIYCNISDSVTVTLGNKTVTLNSGTSTYPGLILARDNGTQYKNITFHNYYLGGTATVGVIYRGGEL